MAKTLAQKIEAVETAIERAEAAQSATAADGRGTTHANLATLYKRLDSLLLRADWAANGRVRALEVP